MIILTCFFLLLNVLVTLLGIANGAGTSPGKQKDASGKQPMEADGAVQEKLNVNVCAICLEEMQNGEPWTLSCDHVFHQSCIKQWLQGHNTCPTCRKEISKKAILRLQEHNTCPTCRKEISKKDMAKKYNLEESQNINNMEINEVTIVELINMGDLNINSFVMRNGDIEINGYPISNEAWRSVNNFWQMGNERIRNETTNARRIRDEALANAGRVLNEALATTRRDEALSTTRRDDASSATRQDEASSATRGDEASETTRGDEASETTQGDEASETTQGDEASETTQGDEASAATRRDEASAATRRDGASPAARRVRDVVSVVKAWIKRE